MLEELREKTFNELEEQKKLLIQEKDEAVNQAKIEASLSTMDGYLTNI